MRLRALPLSLLLTAFGMRALLLAQQPATHSEAEERIALHRSSDWELIAPHLPDPATAREADLEMAADVLKARRFPEDALDYYQYALKQGGDPVTLMKKMGVVRLELQQNFLARAIFQRCVQLARKDAQAWNNLAAADYTLQAYGSSISEYKRAIKLNRRSAVYHANLGMAYLSVGNTESSKAEFKTAMRLDPLVLESASTGGVTLHVLQIQDYARLCLQMATMYAAQGQLPLTRAWLQRAGERGMDLRAAMNNDNTLRPLLKLPEFSVLVANTETLRKHVAVTSVPSLGTSNDATTVPD